MSEALGKSQANAAAGGRVAAPPRPVETQADLIRTLVQRTAAGAPPSVRRRAIVLAGMRIAKTGGSNERGKA